jgi:hypothetical protein
MSQRVHRNARGEVKEFAPVTIPYPASLPLLQYKSWAGVDREKILFGERKSLVSTVAQIRIWDRMGDSGVCNIGSVGRC